MKNTRKLLIPAIVAALVLTACGGSAYTSSAVSPDSSDSLFQLSIGAETVTLAPSQRYFSWDQGTPGTECFDLNTEAVTKRWEGNTITTSENISLGASLDQIMQVYDIEPNFAQLNYEYDPYGDGCTDVANHIYDGTLPDWETAKVLDLCISIGYAQKSGQWQRMDLSQQSYSDYDGPCVVYDFDFTEQEEGNPDSAALDNLTISYYTP